MKYIDGWMFLVTRAAGFWRWHRRLVDNQTEYFAMKFCTNTHNPHRTYSNEFGCLLTFTSAKPARGTYMSQNRSGIMLKHTCWSSLCHVLPRLTVKSMCSHSGCSYFQFVHKHMKTNARGFVISHVIVRRDVVITWRAVLCRSLFKPVPVPLP